MIFEEERLESKRNKTVQIFTAVIGNIMSILVLCMFAAGVMKLFELAGTLNDIKETLADIRRNGSLTNSARPAQAENRPEAPKPVTRQPQTGEEILRALDREMGLPSDETAATELEGLRARIEASQHRSIDPGSERPTALNPEIVEPGDRRV